MSIARLGLRHAGGTTPIWVGEGALAEFAPEIENWIQGRTVFVVTSPRVWSLHGGELEGLLGSAANARRLEVPEGESAKSSATVERLWSEMLHAGGKRDSRVIAFGGGSVGDVAGFAAGCFLRGVSLLQLPTTLLAQVDASIGGKTGINLPAAKNSVGLFHQPWATVADIRFLSTLSQAELRSGLFEVVKAGVILDAELFAGLEANTDGLKRRSTDLLAPVVAQAAQAKIDVVERDPTESDQRRLLNFGHTLGHALESQLGYSDLRHGEAVGHGMLFALRLASRRGLDTDTRDRIRRLILELDLPELPPVEANDLLRSMSRDKKARQEGLVWILPTRLGAGRAVAGIPDKEVSAELESFLEDPRAAV